jgi:uncharacterized protein involved in type VI secretion and phage assembly
MKQYFGKYRGKVENPKPDDKGRIQVSVGAVLGDSTLSHAMPCVPYAGPGVGFFAIPPKGANVWIEFESGDPDRPIWSGCFWDPDDRNDSAPVSPAVADKKVLKTNVGTITLDDSASGGITIETTKNPKMKLAIDSKGIEITNGSASVKLSNNTVSINGTALEVQ